jgi:nitrite reductase (NADH) large subunit
VIPRIPGGEITPEKLIVLGEIARSFDLYCKITGGQRIDLLGARVDQAAGHLGSAGRGGLRERTRLRQGDAHGEELHRLDVVPLRRAGQRRPRDPRRGALPRHPRAAQAQVGGVRLHPRVRGGAEQGLRRSSRPRTAGTSTCAATAARSRATPTSSRATVDEATVLRLIDRFLMFYIHTRIRSSGPARWVERQDGGIDT